VNVVDLVMVSFLDILQSLAILGLAVAFVLHLVAGHK